MIRGMKQKIKKLPALMPLWNGIHKIKRLPSKIKKAAAKNWDYLQHVLPILRIKVFHPRTVFYVFTPEHGNLGDHAIAKAIGEFLNESHVRFFECSYNFVYDLFQFGRLGIFNGRTIVMQGGGYLGTIWYGAEELTRHLIENNPKSRIFIMPNTIFYENNEWGQEELQKSIAIYNAHEHLTIYARENTSYQFMKPIYRNVKLVPDMVLRLNEMRESTREGCALCMRGDIEKTISAENSRILDEWASRVFGKNVSHIDTVVDYSITRYQREEELSAFCEKYSRYALVITDRMHGMVFAAITGTPCIVVNSKSPKIRGCYEWLKDLDYIRYCEDLSEIDAAYESIPKGKHSYSNEKWLPYYDEIKNDLLQVK